VKLVLLVRVCFYRLSRLLCEQSCLGGRVRFRHQRIC